MKYDAVQQSLEEFVRSIWIDTELEFDNVAFNSDLFDEYCRVNILFGEGAARAINRGCYRYVGVLKFSVFTKPAEGTARKLALVSLAAEMMTKAVVQPIPPLEGPVVNLQVPELFSDNKERNGWVMAQLTYPFYYDWEQ